MNYRAIARVSGIGFDVSKFIVFALLITSLILIFASQVIGSIERFRPVALTLIVLSGGYLFIKFKVLSLCLRGWYLHLILFFYLMSLPAAILISGSPLDSFSILTIGCLIMIVAPAYWFCLGTRGVAYAGVIAGLASYLLVYKVAGASAFLDGNSMERLTLSNSHPNLLGYCAMAFFSFSLILIVSGRWLAWLLGFTLSVLSVVLMVKANSRGAFFASLFGFLFFLGLLASGYLLKNKKCVGHFQRSIMYALCMLIVLIVSTGVFLLSPSLNSSIKSILMVDDQYRGIDSGMSGRVDIWHSVIQLYSIPEFLTGIGVRETERDGLIIDNSYIVMCIENGFFGLLAFLVLVVSRLYYWLFRGDFTLKVWIISFTCVAFIVCVMANNFVARYLFSIGNSGGVLALLVLGYIPFSSRFPMKGA